MFAPFALTPITIHPTGQTVPANVPNPHYQPEIQFQADRLADWFESRDNANLAVIRLRTQMPEGAVALRVCDEAECPEGLETQRFSIVLPSVPTLPMRPFA